MTDSWSEHDYERIWEILCEKLKRDPTDEEFEEALLAEESRIEDFYEYNGINEARGK